MIVPGMKSNLKVLMAERGLVRRDVIEGTGLSSRTLTKINNHQNVYLESLAVLCRFFDVPLSKLVTITPNGTD